MAGSGIYVCADFLLRLGNVLDLFQISVVRMNQEARIHPLWEEFEKIKSSGYKVLKPGVGKWQYLFSSKKGKISCVQFTDYFLDGKDFWEIYCLEGDLFDGTPRFDTLKEARIASENILDRNRKIY